jgi:hypothetical protein
MPSDSKSSRNQPTNNWGGSLHWCVILHCTDDKLPVMIYNLLTLSKYVKKIQKISA